MGLLKVRHAESNSSNRLAPDQRGFSLTIVAIAVTLSAVLVSTIYAVVKTGAGGDDGLRRRVEFQLDAVRVLREVSETLKNAQLIEVDSDGASRKIVFRRTGDDDSTGLYAIVLVLWGRRKRAPAPS